MAKKSTVKKPSPPPLPKASQEQIDRIDELGAQVYQDDWDENREAIFGRPMTPNRARNLIYQLQHILGTKV